MAYNNEFKENQISDLDIAIIGMSGRFPKASNLDKFWQNLKDGLEAISFFSDQELESIGVDKTTLNDPNYVKAKAVLEDIELFDAGFFDYSPKTAEIIDPQHRLFLETAWEALESAGYDSKTYQGRIGVYGSASISSYFLFNLFSNPELIKLVGLDQIRHNNRTDNLTTRVAYKLDLKGSAITIQTGCSSSLVAVHLACQSLIDRESDLVLAGGVSITNLKKTGYAYQEGGILSPDGHCRAFDAKAQGTVGGDGVGIVILKRLADAIADRDYIHAVIKGSAINNDGSAKVGYTAPSIDGQAKVIAEALAISRIEPDMVSYIETHGTGTVLGDPIEIAALTKSFRARTQKKNFCAIGSVKTNIGHLDTASGVAGLIKTVLALKHKQIPPSLHFQEPSPQIDFANSPFYVNDKLSEWKSNGHPRRAGVSSFGIGGTNAHVILEEALVMEQGGAKGQGRKHHLLVVSAKTESALEAATANLANHFKQHPNLNLADVAYTLGVGRRAFDYRRMVVCQDIDDAIKVLETKDTQRVFTHYQKPGESEVVFMFPGQGSQYVDMGRELYQTEPIFREQVDDCCEQLKPILGLDLRTILYPSQEQTQWATELLTQTHITQAALFAIEYALAQLWLSRGVYPSAMIGHSIGEYVAACLAGVFSLADALMLVATRGQLMQQLPLGAMLAVALPEKKVTQMLGDQLSLAAINAPERCVVSGPTAEIEDLQNRLTEQGIDCRFLHTSHAFHSQMMDFIIEPFTKLFAKINLNYPKIPFLSNVTGTWITPEEATDNNYWAKHLRSSVRFADGITELCKQPNRIFLEVGSGRTLSTLTKQQAQGHLALCSIRHLHDQQSDVAFLLNTLGHLWLSGIQVDWSGFYANQKCHRLALPTYPFERQKYWVESSKDNDFNPLNEKDTHNNQKLDNEKVSSRKNHLGDKSQHLLVQSPQNNILNLSNKNEKRDNPAIKIIDRQISIMFQQLELLEKDM
ncbi:type I polyketide synthase [Nostoc sp. PCC 9305]|uniref:type I polyketide synthase n=1 Tax=Nostoc sp. PCC 9305 TaxID=296636 RepID=UPI0039C646E8